MVLVRWIFSTIVRRRRHRDNDDNNDDNHNSSSINDRNKKDNSNRNNNNNINNTKIFNEKNMNNNDDYDNDHDNNMNYYYDKPPLMILNGLPYFIITNICMQYGHLILFDYHHTIYNGLFIYFGICILMVLLDGYVSNHFGMNIITLRQYTKYTDNMISSIMLYNLITSQTLTWFIFHIICKGLSYDILLSWYATPISMYQYSYISYVIFAVIINISMTELLFYYGHKLLHEKYPSVHIMHHCCLLPSNSTNFIFHPIDMIIEFGGPGIFLLLSHYIIWKHNISIMMLSYSIVQVYYAWDHSDYLKSFHYHHHTHHDAVYTIYIKYKSNPKLDQIRQYIKNT